MARQKLTFRRADVNACWLMMEKMGLEPVAVKFHPDGTFRIMTRKHVEAKYGPAAPVTSNSLDQAGAAYDDWKRQRAN